jgi:hypothetical protein
MRLSTLILSGALSLAATVALAAPAADSAAPHFSHRYAVELSGQAAYYTMSVPQGVYAASERSDLGDLRVLNGAGEPVPYTLQTQADPVSVNRVRRSVDWFALPASNRDVSAAHSGVTIAADGSLHVRPQPQTSEPQRRDDLIDLGQHHEGIDALWIHLRNDSYQGRVSVEQSDDLRAWEPLGDATLLRASRDGKWLLQERVDVDGLRSRYVRLHWIDEEPAIESVEIETATQTAGVPDATLVPWRDVRVRAGQAAGEYRFDTDGAYPVEALRLGLPQRNTVVNATIESRNDAQQPWQQVASASLFRIEGQSGETRNEPVRFAANPDRQWRVLVDTRSGGLGNGVPTAAIRWRPAQLTFLARGNPPFELAIGNRGLSSVAVTRRDLLLGGTPEIATAQLGAAKAVDATSPPTDAAKDGDATRRIALWGALIVAVGVLALLALRVARGGASGS